MSCQAGSEGIGEADRAAIEAISVVGVAVSCTSLLLIIVAYACFWGTVPREQVRDKTILVALAASLLAAMVLYLVGQADVGEATCAGLGASMHYALLSTFALMAREREVTYKEWVRVGCLDFGGVRCTPMGGAHVQIRNRNRFAGHSFVIERLLVT